MIVDINAWTGSWGTLPVAGQVEKVRHSLKRIGVERICLSPLNAVWGHNPHLTNQAVYQAAHQWEDLWPVPVLDPTIATWKKELEQALAQPRMRLVKLVPAYGPYELSAAKALLEALARVGLAAIVQTRMEDPRRQHPLAQVPDLPPESVVEAAQRHPDLKLIIGGAPWTNIAAAGDALRDQPNLYAEVSQADGMDRLKLFVEQGLGKKLLFGSHAPLFMPLAALARVVTDLGDEEAKDILAGNAQRILDHPAR